MTSAENSVSEPPNVKKKIEGIGPLYKARAFGTRDNASLLQKA